MSLFDVIIVLCSCAFLPLWGSSFHHLATFKGWLALYGSSTSLLDVWLLAIARACLLLHISKAINIEAKCYHADSATIAAHGKHEKLLAELASYSSQLLLFTKSIVVAISHPGNPWPSQQPPGNVGLACIYTILALSIIATLVERSFAKQIIKTQMQSLEERVESSEEASSTTPLLAKGQAGTADGKSGSLSKDKKRKKPVSQKTVLQLARMSTPDLPIVMIAFTAGSAAALFQACVPYYTGQTIDYASLDPDRWEAARHGHRLCF